MGKLRKTAIVGGETHIGEISSLAGQRLEIVGAAVREAQVQKAREDFGGLVTTDFRELLDKAQPEIVAVANENDRKAEVCLEAIRRGMDLVVDKPLAITEDEQRRIEESLEARPGRRLLMLLTLRGQPLCAGLRQQVQSGAVGAPAFCHVRMAVKLKRAQRPPWFLDARRSGGLFPDLLIHGIDQVEWLTGARIQALCAVTGNLGDPADERLRDHAAVFCELDNGGSAVVEGQRMLPDTKASDYRILVAGTEGYADLSLAAGTLTLTKPAGADTRVEDLPAPRSVVADWLDGGELVAQAASLRANRLAIMAAKSAEEGVRIALAGPSGE